MQRIIVSVTNDINTDQRLHRICLSLVEMGLDVSVIGRRLPDSLPVKQHFRNRRIRLFFNKGFLFYAEYNLRLFFMLLFFRKDILWANDMDTLLPNYLISKLLKKKLVFDSHELFSEIPELVNRPHIKNIWKQLEDWMIPNIKNGITVSGAIARYYEELYQVDFKVIRNLPQGKVMEQGSFPFETSGKQIVLYQGALNMGRGLELLIDTLAFLSEKLLVLIGDGDIKDELKNKVEKMGLSNIVIFLDKMYPDELKQLTPLADIGVSLEEDIGLNYRYALPNKLFDYIQAEIPVLVSNLPEMSSVVKDYRVGEVVSERTSENLAKQIGNMLARGKEPFQESLKLAAKQLNWEVESEKLKEVISTLNE